jgi:hypothetical protein
MNLIIVLKKSVELKTIFLSRGQFAEIKYSQHSEPILFFPISYIKLQRLIY